MQHFWLPAEYQRTQSRARIPSPFLWGDPEEVRRRFADAASIQLAQRTLTLRYRSVDEWRERFAAMNPPIRAMEQILPPEAYARLIEQCRELVTEMNTATDGGITLESEVLFVVATSPRG